MDEGGFIFDTPDGEVELTLEEVKKMADDGDPNGLCALAKAYLYGWGVDEDRDLGMSYLGKAVDAGHSEAKTIMVSMFLNHEYDGITAERASQLAREAAEDGISDAQLFAGLAYMDGIGVPEDVQTAAKYFRMAANQGNFEARANLAYLYMNGIGVPKDEAKAFKMFRTAAKAGNVNACFHMGVCYEFGVGAKEDLKQALEWYRKASEMNDALAMERIGYLYLKGVEGDPEPETAFEWLIQSANMGVPSAMMAVGDMYLTGNGVEKNEEEAVKWVKMASTAGVEEADEFLAKYNSSPHGTLRSRRFHILLDQVEQGAHALLRHDAVERVLPDLFHHYQPRILQHAKVV